MMRRGIVIVILAFSVVAVGFLGLTQHLRPVAATEPLAVTIQDQQIVNNALTMIDRGKQIFRFDTFGDQAFWGGQMGLHNTIKGAFFGGIGPGLNPATALALGLKVDVDALPAALALRFKNGQVNLLDTTVTLELLQLNAIIGVTGFFNANNNLVSVGIQCALCHSTVDNSLVPSIGHRLDGWANRDLNVGAIIAFAPNMTPLVNVLKVAIPGITPAQVRAVLNSWGPGKFDAELILDGKTVNPNTGKSSAVLLPPLYGMPGVNLHTWTGWGSATHWNAFVANLEMHGKGTFFDPRLNNAAQFPIAAALGFGNVRVTPDLITAKLAPLHFYQMAIPAPRPPAGSFNAVAAARGQIIFNGKAKCATCHVPPLFTEPGWNMHTPAEVFIDAFQADRAPDRRYRTSPLKGLFAHQKGGFFHDGRFATLLDVVNHFDTNMVLGLTPAEKADLVQFLLSL